MRRYTLSPNGIGNFRIADVDPTQVGHRFQADIDGIYQGLDGSFIGDVDALSKTAQVKARYMAPVSMYK